MTSYSLRNVFAVLTNAVRPLPKAACVFAAEIQRETLIPVVKSSQEAATMWISTGAKRPDVAP